MGSIGTAEIVVILIAALLILGPQKLPGAARQVGKALSEFRRMANGFQSDIKEAFSEDPEPPSYQPAAIDPPRYEPPRYEPPVPSPEDDGPPALSDDDMPAEQPIAYTPPATPQDAELPPPPDDPSRN